MKEWIKLSYESPIVDTKVWFRDPKNPKAHAIGIFVGFTPGKRKPCFRNNLHYIVSMSRKIEWCLFSIK